MFCHIILEIPDGKFEHIVTCKAVARTHCNYALRHQLAPMWDVERRLSFCIARLWQDISLLH